ncbi:hypothetical protein [Bradyrhizobium sp. Ai1a-2]|uniref:hypothetical protein n=1 Tax=Bradyrhizobium sp. Ai1a-2 TaxID=196490 RepID=UPI000487FCB4|nr:hypothetical protein [Bradyrhizobium sp. Ai1a-2]
MKKVTLGFAAAVVVGLSSFSVPATAMPMHQVGAANSEVIQARYHRKVCTVRNVVTRGPHGRRIVKHVRVCR